MRATFRELRERFRVETRDLHWILLLANAAALCTALGTSCAVVNYFERGAKPIGAAGIPISDVSLAKSGVTDAFWRATGGWLVDPVMKVNRSADCACSVPHAPALIQIEPEFILDSGTVKPAVFVGTYSTPREFVEDFYGDGLRPHDDLWIRFRTTIESRSPADCAERLRIRLGEGPFRDPLVVHIIAEDTIEVSPWVTIGAALFAVFTSLGYALVAESELARAKRAQ